MLVIQKRKTGNAALAAEVEHWLRLTVDDYPRSLREITDPLEFGFLGENLGPASEQILRRIVGTHPRSEIRWEAGCALVIHQMGIASLVAGLRSVAALPLEAKHCAGPGLEAASVFGGETRLNAVDSTALVREIEERLGRIADRVNDVKKPGLCFFHLIVDTPTLFRYHAGTELLLRRVAEGHPDRRLREGVRCALTSYLAGITALSRTIDADRSYWVDRLGEERVEQISRLNADHTRKKSTAD